MSGTASPEHSKTEKPKSLRLYATKVFQESYVSVLSSAVNTSSIKRRIFKAIAFFSCLTGFLYQTSVFLSAVYKYPTTVETNVLRPDSYSVPAYTFCNNNGINKRIFCEKFPDRCEVPTEAFCNRYRSYCGENGTKVPKENYFDYQNYLDVEELSELNNELEDFVLDYSDHLWSQWTTIPREPLLRHNYFPDRKRFLCYSVNDRVNNELDPPPGYTPYGMWQPPVHKFLFRVSKDEIFLPEGEPGVLFALHSPFEAVNPFRTGIFMKPGRKYMVYITMEEKLLLKSPYDTDCTNYTEVWEKNGRSGPRTQKMCKDNCKADMYVQCYKCIPLSVLYPRSERLCEEGFFLRKDKSCLLKEEDDLFQQCETTKCKDDCRQVRYYIDVQERFEQRFDRFGSPRTGISEQVKVEIYLEDDQIFQFRHIPKYMFVEAFSNVGGFIGCWLGISLLDITDVFEGLIRVLRYALKKR